MNPEADLLPPPEPLPSLPIWKRAWGKVGGGWRATVSFWQTVRPGAAGHSGMRYAAFITITLLAIYMGPQMRTGLGWAADILICLVISLLALLLGGLAAMLLRWLLRFGPFTAGALLVSGFLLSFVWGGGGFAIGGTLAVANALAGVAVLALWRGSWRDARRWKRGLLVTMLVLGLGVDAAMAVVCLIPGSDAHLVKYDPGKTPLPALTVENPSQRGPFAVHTLTYGSGSDRWRKEFASGAALKTEPVDGSLVLKALAGFKGRVRKWYWGFDAEKLPLNARVWYPDGPGPFPLTLIVHGNHQMEDYSDPGYAYLGELLASRGFILASVDENFLNADWSGDLNTEEQPARGWLLLKHLERWRKWNAAPGNPFHGKVDMENIALMGHSRGGEAAATATAYNSLTRDPEDANVAFEFGFRIRAVVAIAPSDGQYKPVGAPRRLQNVSYFVLQGGHDADVSTFSGSRQYQRVTFTEPGPWFKSELWIYRANHGQFNTVWNRFDSGPPQSLMLNLKTLLTPEEQRRYAEVYIPAFLEATLKGKREYVSLFRDQRVGAPWLPRQVCLTRYQDASFQAVANYEDDINLETGSVPGVRIASANLVTWKERRIPMRWGDRENNAVQLGWNTRERKDAWYAVQLPPGWKGGNVLTFSAADLGEIPELPKKDKDKKKEPEKKKEDPKPVDFTVELASSGGVVAALPLSHFRALAQPLKARFLKIKWLNDQNYKESEPVMQTFELPLAEFTKANPKLDPATLETIRLRFNKTDAGAILLDDVGFSSVP